MAHRMLLSLAAVLLMAVTAAPVALAQGSGPAAAATRSEERRVGKEC